MARKASSQTEATANLGFEVKLWLAAESESSVDSQPQIARWASEARQYKHTVLSLSRSEIFIYGQDKWVRLRGQQPKQSNATTRRLAIMNLAIRSIEADFGPKHADTFRCDLHPDLRADYVLATAMRDSTLLNAKPYRRACRRQDNPMPFNDSDWFRKDDDVRWQWSGATWTAEGCPQGERGSVHQFGVPPMGNANFAWLQHFIHHLAPQTALRDSAFLQSEASPQVVSAAKDNMACFVLANGSMSSNQSGEGDIRKALIEFDLVDCMVALPGQLFYSTPIPVCLWFIAKNKNDAKRLSLPPYERIQLASLN